MTTPTPTPPAHARPSHSINTPRLLLRSAIPTDATASTILWTEPLNNPFGGVVDFNASYDKRLASIHKQALTTASGKDAFMQVILKDATVAPAEFPAGLKVVDGVMIGMSGFNSFPVGEDGALVGDVGALIDCRFQRRGFAVETLSAVFEYGFGVLGVRSMALDTEVENKPWRELMKRMGLGGAESLQTGDDEGKSGEVVYRFDRDMWEGAKEEMKKNGKWYL
ncbi:hypothetical protein BP6252_07177 [Coleophoma cylindrospora]|uniref:N-acetyltransferase domain-containing protein n=1 Tax=Coleophoma cylindrospora TaxID=1849047 RepID=A0A3D8RH31_9HELO|nr:hypothetical protein BP6252_07177 [Coleophoma cylindrospora]